MPILPAAAAAVRAPLVALRRLAPEATAVRAAIYLQFSALLTACLAFSAAAAAALRAQQEELPDQEVLAAAVLVAETAQRYLFAVEQTQPQTPEEAVDLASAAATAMRPAATEVLVSF